MTFRFEELQIWRDAVTFCGLVYEVTGRFPKDEVFGLTSQLRRAATSIASNIAEGTGRSSQKDFSHFLDIAVGSVFEVVTQLRIARDRDFLPDTGYRQLYGHAEALAKKISTFKRKLLL